MKLLLSSKFQVFEGRNIIKVHGLSHSHVRTEKNVTCSLCTMPNELDAPVSSANPLEHRGGTREVVGAWLEPPASGACRLHRRFKRHLCNPTSVSWACNPSYTHQFRFPCPSRWFSWQRNGRICTPADRYAKKRSTTTTIQLRRVPFPLFVPSFRPRVRI